MLTNANEILAGNAEVDQVYWTSVKEIVDSGLWYPGDHDFYCLKKCNYLAGTHYCFHRATMWNRWHEIMTDCRKDKSYNKLLKRIKRSGFAAPVASKVGHNSDYIVVADGHHRITVAYDLDLDLVPVYIGRRGRRLTNLVAIDSQSWGSTVNSPFFKEFYDAAQKSAEKSLQAA